MLKQSVPPTDQIFSAAKSSANEFKWLPASNNLKLPPPPVLWAWLSYIYEVTGEWVLPPTYSQNSGYEAANIKTNAAPSPEPVKVQAEAQTHQVENQPLVYQFPIPAMLPYTPVAAVSSSTPVKSLAKTTADNAPTEIIRTGYDYVNSEYFAEASRLIQRYSTSPVNSSLAEGCRLVLALIITWCQFPLFNGSGNRKGQWITLSYERLARELKIRTAHLQLYLNELQRIGLLLVGNLSSGIISREEFEQLKKDCTIIDEELGGGSKGFWKPRSIQEKNNIYLLRVVPAQRLPQFNPFENNLNLTNNLFATQAEDSEAGKTSMQEENTLGKTFQENIEGRERLGKDLTNREIQKELENSSNRQPGKTFPESDSWYKTLNDDGKNISDQPNENTLGESNTLGLAESREAYFKQKMLNFSPEQQAKFEFLSNKARFEGYISRDGKTTLDIQEAIKFACQPALSLDIIKERYEQVNLMWLNQECRKNPLGLLHWALSENKNPIGYARRPASSNYSTQPRSSTYSKPRTPRPFKKREMRATKTAQDFLPEIIDENTLNEVPELSSIVPEPSNLWERICRAIEERFRQPELSAKLSKSYLELELESHRALIVFPNAWLAGSLLSTERALIQMAFSQEAGPGYQLEFLALPLSNT